MSRNWERALYFTAGLTLGAGTLITIALVAVNLNAIGCC